MKTKQWTILLILLIGIVSLMILVTAADNNLVTIDIINNSGSNSTQGGGFVVYSTNGILANGTSMTLNAVPDSLRKSLLNLSGIININLSLIVNGSHGGYGNVTFSWILNTNGSIMRNSTVQNSTANQSAFNYSFNTNTLAEGIYNISVYVQNWSMGIESPVVNLTRAYDIAIDRTPPNVTDVLVGNLTNGINLSADLAAITGNYLVNLSAFVNDSTTYVQFVAFNITNSSGTIFSSYYLNSIRNATTGGRYFSNGTLPVMSGSTSNATGSAINISSLAEGKYNITVLANDSLNNRNNSVAFSFTIDRTAHSVSVSCTSNPTVGSTATCTCSASDSTSGLVPGFGFQGGSTTESTTASTVGTFSSSTCTASDYAGNRATATGSWTTVASSSSSGGGSSGGSASGVSTGVQSQFQKKVWSSINAGESASIPVKEGLGVTEISFAVDKTTYGAWLQVEKEDKLPTNIKSVQTKVYKNLKITESNIGKVIKGPATINFKVEKTWLSSNNINANDVVMKRYVDGEWVELTTTKGEDDGTYVHYTTQTPGFSYFVISQKSGATAPKSTKKETTTAAPITEKPAESVVVQPEEKSTEEVKGEPTPAEIKTKRALWPWIVVVLVVIALAWYFLRPRKKSNY